MNNINDKAIGRSFSLHKVNFRICSMSNANIEDIWTAKLKRFWKMHLQTSCSWIGAFRSIHSIYLRNIVLYNNLMKFIVTIHSLEYHVDCYIWNSGLLNAKQRIKILLYYWAKIILKWKYSLLTRSRWQLDQAVWQGVIMKTTSLSTVLSVLSKTARLLHLSIRNIQSMKDM